MRGSIAATALVLLVRLGLAKAYTGSSDGQVTAPSERLERRVGRFAVQWTASGTRVAIGVEPELTFEVAGVGRGEAIRPLGDATFEAAGCRSEAHVEHSLGCDLRVERVDRATGVHEWWQNDRGNLEQGFTLDRAPAARDASSPIVIDLALGGAVARVEAIGDATDSARIVTSSGRALIYGALKAWDADGVPLRAELTTASRGLRISVVDTHARYPITIDPLLASPGAMGALRPTPQAGSQYAAATAGAGDVNGDGFDDVLVGAPRFTNVQANEGRAFLYLGSPFGLSASAAWTTESNLAGAELGSSVASAGDVDGDGFADILVGAPLYTNGQSAEGRVFLFKGGPNGPSASATWTWEPDSALAHAGSAVASAGDINRDGFADVLVAADRFTNGESEEGAVFVFHGSKNGLPTTPSLVIEGGVAGGHFGYAIAKAGDIDGDSFADVLVGAPDSKGQGRVALYRGTASGLSSIPAWTVDGTDPGARLGASVSSGDFNGDGRRDVIIGAPDHTSTRTQDGRVTAYYGAATGLPSAPSYTLDFKHAYAHGGQSIAGLGDVDGDGIDDMAVAFGKDPVEPGVKSAWVVLGTPTGLRPTHSFGTRRENPPAIPQSGVALRPRIDFAMGGPAAAAGDIDGDGFADVLFGAAEALCVGKCWDYDGDLLDDVDEVIAVPRLDPASWDSDGDGCSDFVDGAWYESSRARNAALRPTDTSVCDFDADGLTNAQEASLGTDPARADTDGDLISDYQETRGGHVIDTDKDGVRDALDADSDGDGVPDVVEGLLDLDRDRVPAYRDANEQSGLLRDGGADATASDAGANGSLDGASGGDAAIEGGPLPIPPPPADDCAIAAVGMRDRRDAPSSFYGILVVAGAVLLERRRRAARAHTRPSTPSGAPKRPSAPPDEVPTRDGAAAHDPPLRP